MYKVILILFLAVMSTSAFANWSEIGSVNNDTVYVDSSTIRRNDDVVKVWFLHSLMQAKAIEGSQYLSEKRLSEYDCKTEEVRTHAHFFFSERMGNGDVIFSKQEASYWKLVEPASVDYASMELACSKLYELKSFGTRFINRILNLE